MIDIGTLDTIIAMVIVLLVLSLLVQSIQSLIKKLLKLKSAVVMNSMLDLFQYVKSKELIGKEPEEFVELVRTEFEQLGRETVRGKLMLDSISKDDFLKIVDRIGKNLAIDGTKIDNFKKELDTWFDAVMQSFDERYTRNMKSFAIGIAAIVVIVLNANVFTVYKNIALNDVMRAAILRMGPEVQKQATSSSKTTPNAQPAATSSANPLTTNPQTSRNPPTASAKPSPNPSASPAAATSQPSPGESKSAVNKSDEQAKEDIKESVNQIQQFVNDYKGLGFSPLRPQQVSDFFNGERAWKDVPPGQRFLHALKVLLGWGIMTLLLSVGAPFWEDTLESLFGVKNLLQKKTKKNGQDGGGQ
jgi:hypothetical protein